MKRKNWCRDYFSHDRIHLGGRDKFEIPRETDRSIGKPLSLPSSGSGSRVSARCTPPKQSNAGSKGYKIARMGRDGGTK